MRSSVQRLVLLALIPTCEADSTPPKALVIPPSEYFEGNDGPWSSFDIRVGTPGQDVRVLVSTASPESMVVLSPEGCSKAAFNQGSPPSDCAVSRGNLFTINESSSWHGVGTYGINQNRVGLEANLGYTQRAQFGLEKMAIGLTGPALDNQTVAGIATPEPFYLGILGINSQPVNFTSLGNFSSPSFFTTLKSKNKIPSLSWSYTAGAKYRLKQVYGQLIFSGYDTSRFDADSSVSFTMAGDVTRDLVVSLQSISYNGPTSATLLSDPIDIFIDSTDPNIWLPGEVCDAFEDAFGLALDKKSGLYLVNETHRNTLLDQNAEVAFRLSDVSTGGATVTIVLPYAAFDLTAEAPLVESSSHYFPLKRAENSTQYTLGRTFLQEAYITADYERSLFNVSACVWNQGAKQNVVTVLPDNDGSTGGSDDKGEGGRDPSSNSHLGGGAIAGIAVGCVGGGLLLAGVLALVILRRRRRRMKQAFAANAADLRPDEAMLKGPVHNSRSTVPSRSVSNSNGRSSSTPWSPADVSGLSASASTGDRSRSAAEESPVDRPETIHEGGDQTRCAHELDGAGLYELPDSEINRQGKEPEKTSVPAEEVQSRESRRSRFSEKST